MALTDPCAAPPPAGLPPADHLHGLRDALRDFAAARQWQPYHAPKNLAVALAVEAAELMEPFQWMSEADSRHLPPDTQAHVAGEVADVLLYLVQLADQLGIDPVEAAWTKLRLNATRFPVPGQTAAAPTSGTTACASFPSTDTP